MSNNNIVQAYACYTPDDTTLTFYYDNQRNSRLGTTYGLNYRTGQWSSMPDWEDDGTNYNVTKVVFDPSFADARPTTTYDWFYRAVKLETIEGLEYLNTSEVIDMGRMFCNCSNLTSLDVRHFNTSEVINMGAMFYHCAELTSLDLSSFNTSKVTNMQEMFNFCSGLKTLDVSHFNTANVTDMQEMFDGCSSLTSLDLSSFSTASVKYMSYMFGNCYNLRTIYVGNDWKTAVSRHGMFYHCYNLVGGQGTKYNSSHTDKTYARIDGGTNNPGYFTNK